jgi:hypothetical protein
VRCPALLVSGELDDRHAAVDGPRPGGAMGDARAAGLDPGTGHNDLFGRPETWVEVHRFLGGPR